METSELIKKVRKIEIKSRGLSNQIFSGHYHSAFKGRGMAFSEVREYQYGDDIRSIDWNVTARFNHPYIKVFEEERELTLMLLIDCSSSNLFGTQSGFKSDVITELAAILSFSALNNNDKVGALFFSDKVEKFISPAKGKTHILRIIRELIDFKPEQKNTNIAEALRYLTNVIKKKATVFILSDFIDSNYKKALQIASKKHDIAAIRVFDPREQIMPNIGLVKLQDLENKQEKIVDTANNLVRLAYSNWWKNHHNETEIIFRSTGVDSVNIATNQDYVKPLIRLFQMRERRF